MSESNIKDLAVEKAQEFTDKVSADSRWNLEDELMCQIFGFTMYGFIFGVGRIRCFMDVEEIKSLVGGQLTNLGVGAKYVEGMMDVAETEFSKEGNQSFYNRLMGIGHSHALEENMKILVDSVFENTAATKAAEKKSKPWWKFW